MKKSAVSGSLAQPSGALAVLALLLLLASPSLAFAGAKNGLLLWGLVVLPTLFPFMVCSCAIVGLGAVPWLIRPFSPLLKKALRLTESGSYILLTGLLCGYPMGAKTCGEFLRDGKVRLPEAQYLLAISNHPSPMFLLGYVMSQINAMPGSRLSCPPWRVLLALYLPILPLAFLARRLYRPDGPDTDTAKRPPQAVPFFFDGALMACAETMVKIGGYIMLFSILALYAARLPLPPALRAALLGGIEITTGIQAIALSIPGEAGALLITAAAAFGGLSGIFQTRSVLALSLRPEEEAGSGRTGRPRKKNAGLSIRHYVLWKGLHALCSALCFILSGFLPLPPLR